jgi:hypothetical protein
VSRDLYTTFIGIVSVQWIKPVCRISCIITLQNVGIILFDVVAYMLIIGFKPRLHDASLLTRVWCRGWARRRFIQVMESSTGLTLKRL